MAKKQESLLFVGITNKDELRRDVLECSRDVLESLRDYEKFKSTKDEKQKLIHTFKEDIKEITKLMNKLKASIPKVKGTDIKRPERKAVKTVEETKFVRVEKPKEKTELERLESELDDIEGKLNSLS